MNKFWQHLRLDGLGAALLLAPAYSLYAPHHKDIGRQTAQALRKCDLHEADKHLQPYPKPRSACSGLQLSSDYAATVWLHICCSDGNTV